MKNESNDYLQGLKRRVLINGFMSDIMFQIAPEFNCKVFKRCLLATLRRFFIDKKGIYL